MPKETKGQSVLLREWIKNNSNDFKIIDNVKLYCLCCSTLVHCTKKSQFDQHLKTVKHRQNAKKNKDSKIKQQLLEESLPSGSQENNFAKDICNLFIKCNIPLHKVDNPIFKNFVRKYCTEQILPSSSTLRKKYVDLNYKETIDILRSTLKNNYLWFSVDETTDSKGRYISNLIVGILCSETPSRGYLISCKQLEKTNSNTVTVFVHEALTDLFLPEKVPSEKILLMVTDGAAYMIKAGQNLKLFYKNMIHCTCLAHGINRLAETIRTEFDNVNMLIKNAKKVFIKAPLRVQVYREKFPELPLPPEVVLTRWGTWLEAALFYADNYEKVKTVILDFDSESSSAIKECHRIFKKQTLKNELVFIKVHYGLVSKTIKQLENSSLLLSQSIQLVDNLQESINQVPGPVGEKVKLKFDMLLAKNAGYAVLKKINNALNGNFEEKIDEFEFPLIFNFKFAPITSCDVERSFSAYKQILSDKRHNLTVENLEKYIVLYCHDSEN